jgi:hypothetical protein
MFQVSINYLFTSQFIFILFYFDRIFALSMYDIKNSIAIYIVISIFSYYLCWHELITLRHSKHQEEPSSTRDCGSTILYLSTW